MTRSLRTLFVILFICFSLLALPVKVSAFPPLPSSFYGTVQINGGSPPDGTLVEALIGAKVFAYTQTQTHQGASVYALDVPGDDPGTAVVEGGQEGDIIEFKIGGIPASQTAVWHSGTNISLDLTAESAAPPSPPLPTTTAPPTQTAIPLLPTVKQTSGTAPAFTPATAEVYITPTLAAAIQGTQISLPVIAQESAGSSTQATESADKPAAGRNDRPSLWWIAIPAAVFITLFIGLGIYKKRK